MLDMRILGSAGLAALLWTCCSLPFKNHPDEPPSSINVRFLGVTDGDSDQATLAVVIDNESDRFTVLEAETVVKQIVHDEGGRRVTLDRLDMSAKCADLPWSTATALFDLHQDASSLVTTSRVRVRSGDEELLYVMPTPIHSLILSGGPFSSSALRKLVRIKDQQRRVPNEVVTTHPGSSSGLGNELLVHVGDPLVDAKFEVKLPNLELQGDPHGYFPLHIRVYLAPWPSGGPTCDMALPADGFKVFDGPVTTYPFPISPFDTNKMKIDQDSFFLVVVTMSKGGQINYQQLHLGEVIPAQSSTFPYKFEGCPITQL